MIIDAHAHLVAPPELYAYKANLQANRGAHGRGSAGISDEKLRASAQSNIDLMDGVGTDLQLLSPRPYMLMHSETPSSIVHSWIEENNDLIARTVEMFPDRFRGVAGLPQTPDGTSADWLEELERCVTEHNFVGVLLNPDPDEGGPRTKPLDDEDYWYPLFQKMVDLDIPALIHSAACRSDRETYSEHFITEETIAVMALTKSRIFLDFPDLKMIVSHGGGSVPFQIGRWQAARQHARLGANDKLREPYEDSLRRLWFDTVVHDQHALDLLFKVVGTDRCVFGTERPGSGMAPNPATGRDFDDIKPTIEEIKWLTDADRQRIFEDNARQLFPRLPESP